MESGMTGKFRVWYGGEMLYPDEVAKNTDFQWFLGQDGHIYSLVRTEDGARMEREDDAVRTFATGWSVKDEDGNDRELYGGDIVGWNCSVFWNDDGTRKDSLYLVKYSDQESAFMLHVHCVENTSGFFISVGMACKGWRGPADQRPLLVGNRWENPELMGGKTTDG